MLAVSVAGQATAEDFKEPQFRHVFDRRMDVDLHGLSTLAPEGVPYVLISTAPTNGAGGGGPRRLQVVRWRSSGASDAVELTTITDPGSLMAFAATRDRYIVAYQSADGMHLEAYDHEGSLAARLPAPIPEQAPVVVVATGHGIVLVGSHGHFLIDPANGSVLARDDGPESGFNATAALLPGRGCDLATVAVDLDSRVWRLEKRCVRKESFKLKDKEAGPGSVESSHLYSLRSDAVDGSRVLVAQLDTERAWAVHQCRMDGAMRCTTARLDGVPPHFGILLSGLQVFAPDRATLGVISGTEDMRNLWTARYSRRGGMPESSVQWPVPLIREKGYSLVYRVLALPSEGSVWIAYTTAAFDGDWTPENPVTERRMVLALRSVSYQELFPTRH